MQLKLNGNALQKENKYYYAADKNSSRTTIPNNINVYYRLKI